MREAMRMAEVAVWLAVPLRQVYALIKEYLDSHIRTEKSFWHHAGHGIGPVL